MSARAFIAMPPLSPELSSGSPIATATSPASSSGSATEDNDWTMPDYVHMLVLSDPVDDHHSGENGARHVLMLRQHSTSTWDLPFFAYPDSLRYSGDRCVADLERALSAPTLPDRRAFVVVAELLGAHGGSGPTGNDPIGFARLMLIEPQISLSDLSLKPHVAWKDASFVASLLKSSDGCMENRSALEVALTYMRTWPDHMAKHCDPRYQFGWFDASARWLRAEVARHGATPTGPIVQEHISSTSTLLSLACSTGTFYLKSPAVGCEEATITAAVAALFPEDTVDVLGTSKELHSFIMHGFDHVDLKRSHDEAFVRKLGHLQLQSLQHLDTLKAAGCEERGPDEIAEKLREWANDDSERMRNIFGVTLSTFKERVPLVVALCLHLRTYNIPLTLVHGDFAKHNATIVSAKGGIACRDGDDEHCDDEADSSEKILFFDWQYACISHPFCDLHEMHKELTENTMNVYLDLWSEYESRERAREAFELAKNLGWCLKMWTMMDGLQECDLQRSSSRADFLADAFDALVSGLSQTSPGSEATPCDTGVDAGSPGTHLLMSGF